MIESTVGKSNSIIGSNLFFGEWKRSIPYKSDTFAIDFKDEPHLRRRNAILTKHPGIKYLYGPDNSTWLITILCALNQLLIAHYISKVHGMYGNLLLFLCSFFFGATFSQIGGEIIHECCHNLISHNTFINKVYGLIANITVPFPIAMSFKKHHINHHAFQGVPHKDPDLPLDFEVHFVRGNCIRKILWLSFYPVMYVVRGLAVSVRLNQWELINIVFTIVVDLLVYKFIGIRALVYMFLSLWFGYSFHPAAAHFIQEHYTFTNGQETYSYYGPLNPIFMNIGYHNEHHDFPQVPWSKLPLVYAMAPEYYSPLMSHSSWVMVILIFLFDPLFGPQSRVVRSFEDHLKGRKQSVKE